MDHKLSRRADRTAVRQALILIAGFITMFALMIFLIYRLFTIFLPGLWSLFRRGDKAAISSYISGRNRLAGAVVLWVLCLVQVLLVFIPLIPIQIVSGMTYGVFWGSIISFSRAFCANVLVYLVAVRTSRFINALAASFPRLGKWLNILHRSDHRIVYTMMAFLTPGFPNGAIPYRAAHSNIGYRTFVTAALLALPIPTVLTCLAGNLAMSGNVVFSFVSIGVLVALSTLLFRHKAVVVARLMRLPFVESLDS